MGTGESVNDGDPARRHGLDRQHCPCAACTDEFTGELRIKPDSVPMFLGVNDVEAVGRYGIRFRWSDGHDTGIYSFTLLRNKFCRCPVCKAREK